MSSIKPGSNRSKIKNDNSTYLTMASPAAGKVIKEFKTTWRVPTDPVPNQQLLFLWNGVEAGNLFMQPVLAWGVHFQSIPGESTGGPFWEVYNVNAWGDDYISTKCIRVEAGELLEGFITLNEIDNGTYYYSFGFTGEKFSSITVNVASYNPMEFIEECYEPRFESESYLDSPPDEFVKMKNISVQYTDGSFEESIYWQFYEGKNHQLATPSGKNGEIISKSGVDGRVDFYFQ